MSHINRNKYKMVEQRERELILKCMFFLDKGLWPKYYIELRVKLSYVFNIVPYGI